MSYLISLHISTWHVRLKLNLINIPIMCCCFCNRSKNYSVIKKITLHSNSSSPNSPNHPFSTGNPRISTFSLPPSKKIALLLPGISNGCHEFGVVLVN